MWARTTINRGACEATGFWKEVGRTKTCATGDIIDVTCLPNKRYYMLLDWNLATGVTLNRYRFNGDACMNYGRRGQDNDGCEQTFSCATSIGGSVGISVDTGTMFTHSYIANLASDEKLMILHSAENETNGAATAPCRSEGAGKWVNTCCAINRIASINTNAGSYLSCSELVVLGWCNSDTHGTACNFWQELTTANWCSGSTIETCTFPERKYLWVQAWTTNTCVTNTRLKVGKTTIDNCANYSSRDTRNDAACSAPTSINEILVSRGGPTCNLDFLNMFIVNCSAQDKLFIIHGARTMTAGSANVPERQETNGKWANTSVLIDKLRLDTEGNDFTGGTIKVWGSN